MKLAVIFGSVTGNTRVVARFIKNHIQEVSSIDVETLNSDDIYDVGILSNFDSLIIGCSSYDNGNFPPDFEAFLEDIESFEQKPVATFGSGDKFYGDSYCSSVEKLKKVVIKKEGILHDYALKINLLPDETNTKDIHSFVDSFLQKLL